jgi:hypothetical protein
MSSEEVSNDSHEFDFRKLLSWAGVKSDTLEKTPNWHGLHQFVF